MDLINLDLIPGFLMPLLVKENISHKHPNDLLTAIYLLKINEKKPPSTLNSVESWISFLDS